MTVSFASTGNSPSQEPAALSGKPCCQEVAPMPEEAVRMTRRGFVGAVCAWSLSLVRPARAAGQVLTLDQVVGALRRSSPLGAWIVGRSLGDPPLVRQGSREIRFGRLDGAAFVRDRPLDRLVEVANVLVHESCHYLVPVLAAQADPQSLDHPGTVGLVVAPGQIHCVRGQPCFPSLEAAPSFPAFLRRAQRFSLYVDSREPHMVTQKYGLYGLLNEFAAYHAGTRAGLDLVRHLARQPSGSPAAWVNRLADADTTVGAWPEFRGYILAWLAYGRARHPEVYRRIVASSPLRAAWRDVDRSYGSLCQAWYRDLPQMLTGLRQAGIPVQDRDGALMAGGSGRVLYRAEFDAMVRGLRAAPELVEIEKVLARV